jgi:ribosomal protein L24E
MTPPGKGREFLRKDGKITLTSDEGIFYKFFVGPHGGLR